MNAKSQLRPMIEKDLQEMEKAADKEKINKLFAKCEQVRTVYNLFLWYLLSIQSIFVNDNVLLTGLKFA